MNDDTRGKLNENTYLHAVCKLAPMIVCFICKAVTMDLKCILYFNNNLLHV